AKLAVARRERAAAFEQVVRPEVGPEDVGHPEFCVRDLPEEEVAYAELSGGSDQQVGIAHSGCGQIRGEPSFVDLRRLEPPTAHTPPAAPPGARPSPDPPP